MVHVPALVTASPCMQHDTKLVHAEYHNSHEAFPNESFDLFRLLHPLSQLCCYLLLISSGAVCLFRQYEQLCNVFSKLCSLFISLSFDCGSLRPSTNIDVIHESSLLYIGVTCSILIGYKHAASFLLRHTCRQ